MPYIKQSQRQDLREPTRKIGRTIRALPRENHAGALNYALTRIVVEVLGASLGGLEQFPLSSLCRYDKLNRMIGMLECCKLELYRRLAAPYEDIAKERNGDIV